MFDAAEGKAASMSSTLEPFEASTATRANAPTEFFHTGHEERPWWQVDLGGVFVVQRVELYNRCEYAERCDKFGILASLDGTRWRPVYWKRTTTQFGADEHTKLGVEVAFVARYVRVVKTTRGPLHLRRCKVFGSPATRDQAAGAEEQEKAGYQKLVGGRSGAPFFIDAFQIFLDEQYTATVNDIIRGGLYEHRERSLAALLLRPDDRVLEVGTAIGVVAMNAAALVGAENVTTFDANPTMTRDAGLNFAYNRLAIRAHNGVLRNRSRLDERTHTRFYIAREFWASQLAGSEADPGFVGAVDVPFHTLEDEVERCGANVLICDIEGGEYDLLVGADLRRLRLIIAEIHFWAVPAEKLDDWARSIVLQGFAIDLQHTQDCMVVFRRVCEG